MVQEEDVAFQQIPVSAMTAGAVSAVSLQSAPMFNGKILVHHLIQYAQVEVHVKDRIHVVVGQQMAQVRQPPLLQVHQYMKVIIVSTLYVLVFLPLTRLYAMDEQSFNFLLERHQMVAMVATHQTPAIAQMLLQQLVTSLLILHGDTVDPTAKSSTVMNNQKIPLVVVQLVDHASQKRMLPHLGDVITVFVKQVMHPNKLILHMLLIMVIMAFVIYSYAMEDDPMVMMVLLVQDMGRALLQKLVLVPMLLNMVDQTAKNTSAIMYSLMIQLYAQGMDLAPA